MGKSQQVLKKEDEMDFTSLKNMHISILFPVAANKLVYVIIKNLKL